MFKIWNCCIKSRYRCRGESAMEGNIIMEWIVGWLASRCYRLLVYNGLFSTWMMVLKANIYIFCWTQYLPIPPPIRVCCPLAFIPQPRGRHERYISMTPFGCISMELKEFWCVKGVAGLVSCGSLHVGARRIANNGPSECQAARVS